MLYKAVKVRLYPTSEQEVLLAQHFGCARWWWNFGLNKSIETYRETGKGLGRSALNALLPAIKRDKETEWLGECYSQVLQAVTLNLTAAYKNFFEWVEMWRSSARLDYNPQTHVRAIAKHQNPTSIIPEILKYQVKESDLVANREWFLELTKQLHKTRAVAVGGVLRGYMSELEREPEDLIGNTNEGEVDEGHLYFGWKQKQKKYKLVE